MTSGETEDGTLSSAVAELRRAVGSQAKLAAKVGVSERTVKRWERGAVPQRPARDTLIELGIPERLFISAELRVEIEGRLRLLEGEIARIRELLA